MIYLRMAVLSPGSSLIHLGRNRGSRALPQHGLRDGRLQNRGAPAVRRRDPAAEPMGDIGGTELVPGRLRRLEDTPALVPELVAERGRAAPMAGKAGDPMRCPARS